MAPKHYVDNKKLFQEIVAYRVKRLAYIAKMVEYEKAVKKRDRAKAKKLPVPRLPKEPIAPAIPEYIGECLLQIATRVSNKPNFASYSFREDMISDAYENGIRYLDNFNPAKSQNPFAYFTQITHFAFIRRIEKEKHYVYIKYKVALNQTHTGADHVTSHGESYEMKDPSWAGYDNVHNFIREYEEKANRTRPVRVREIADEDDDIVTFDALDDDDSEIDAEADGFVPEREVEEEE